ncbi:DMT family transporter [Brachyspira aalborgi]|uniref:DMT family transporter n=1 Tax=Brachyspira aalborgi TaxID=29522 RepID=A0A5C8G8F6_9SPIR|nr:DMT family transporter [Brachyspira aalborgi]TXJ58144.1 DMT family transporter [Brachyspira aalborgi]
MKRNKILGHTFAFLSVLFWSSLYVSTKILLESFNPLELLVLQFCMGYILLLIIKPKRLKLNNKKEEIYFALAGLTGITIYNLFLNLAMSYSLASNVSVIIAAAPLFTGIFSFILRIEKPYISFFIGFIVSIIGITILSFNGQAELKLNPLGDILAIISSIGWGLYSVIIKNITDMKYDIILSTRKVIFYGIIFMIPSFIFLDFHPNFKAFANPITLFNMIFLVTFASGICFIIWNKATDLIGAIKTNIYVYLTPVITIFVSIIVLKEHITIIAIVGIALTLVGVIISELRY